jgi:hypothetical protein
VSQQVILKKGKFPKVIEIIEQEKHNFKFLRGALADQVNYRCCVGLLLSHFGWDGHGCCTKNFQQADEKLEEIVSINDQWYIAAINDESQSYDEVVERLERDGRESSN